MKEENNGDNPIAQALEGGLPQLLLGPAGKAISRLVGAAVEIPAGLLDEVAQASKDRKEARSKVMQAIADKTAELAVADPKVLDRGLANLLGKAYREQENRESVAKIAMEELATDPPPADSNGPEDDWLNLFEAHSAKASSDKLRSLFGKILAGEVRKPGSFSLSTMHLVSVLDQDTAALINRLAPFLVDRVFAYRHSLEGAMHVSELIELEDAGVLTGSAGTLSMNPTCDAEGYYSVRLSGRVVIRAKFAPNQKLSIGSYIMTRSGRELLSLVELPVNVGAIAKALWHAGAKEVLQLMLDSATNIPIGWMSLEKQ